MVSKKDMDLVTLKRLVRKASSRGRLDVVVSPMASKSNTPIVFAAACFVAFLVTAGGCRRADEINGTHDNKKEANVTELPFLEEYSGQTTDELLGLEGSYRTDSLVLAFEQALDQKAESVGHNQLTNEEKVVLAVSALEREVNNGGYDAFFANPSNQYAAGIVDALKRIGSTRAAQLTQKALDALEMDEAANADAIERAMEEDSEQRDEILATCDEQYYKSAIELSADLLEFIKANRNKILLK